MSLALFALLEFGFIITVTLNSTNDIGKGWNFGVYPIRLIYFRCQNMHSYPEKDILINVR